MKLYIQLIHPKQKLYLKIVASTRGELANIIGSQYFNTNEGTYHVNDVFAEKESSNATAGIIIGGLIGLLAGPWGAVTGSTAGGLIGSSADQDEEKKVSIFNNSSYGSWKY